MSMKRHRLDHTLIKHDNPEIESKWSDAFNILRSDFPLLIVENSSEDTQKLKSDIEMVRQKLKLSISENQKYSDNQLNDISQLDHSETEAQWNDAIELIGNDYPGYDFKKLDQNNDLSNNIDQEENFKDEKISGVVIPDFEKYNSINGRLEDKINREKYSHHSNINSLDRLEKYIRFKMDEEKQSSQENPAQNFYSNVNEVTENYSPIYKNSIGVMPETAFIRFRNEKYLLMREIAKNYREYRNNYHENNIENKLFLKAILSIRMYKFDKDKYDFCDYAFGINSRLGYIYKRFFDSLTSNEIANIRRIFRRCYKCNPKKTK